MRRPAAEQQGAGVRFAFKTSPQDTTWADMLSVWTAADDIDVFESGWTFDHFYPIRSDPSGPCLEGWTSLTALAQATRRLRLGTMVTGAHYRHPAVLANMAATLDIISGGRLEIGIGAGVNQEESNAYGIHLGTPSERSDRFEEFCDVITQLLTRETTSFSGRYYTLTEARCEPKPIQRPHPPLCLGGNGEKRTLRTVARFAQHWNMSNGTPEDFVRRRDVLHAHCADAGRDPAEILLSAQVHLHGPDDIGAAVELAAALGDVGCQLAVVYLPVPHSPQILEPLAAALAQVR
jgi:F420-dependent oxidoreductase-like protein